MVMNFGSFASRVVATKVVATDGTGDFIDIQSAIDDLPAGGGCVYIKEGTYTITVPITINKDYVRIEGCGYCTVIYLADGSNCNVIEVGSAVAGVTGVLLSSFKIEGNSAGNIGTFGIDIEGALGDETTNVGIEQVWVDDVKGRGIYNRLSENTSIRSCLVIDIIGDGIYAVNGPLLISGCTVRNCNGYGIAIPAIALMPRIIITENDVSGCDSHGIYLLFVFNTNIANNMVYNNSQVGVGFGIFLDNNASRNIITGNQVFDDQGAVTQNAGIRIDDATCDKNIINSNVVINNTVNIVDNGTDTDIGHNIAP